MAETDFRELKSAILKAVSDQLDAVEGGSGAVGRLAATDLYSKNTPGDTYSKNTQRSRFGEVSLPAEVLSNLITRT